MIDHTEAQQMRKRRHHTRSRNGCFACKERHVRCDEARPSCANCVVGNRDCKYAPPSFPLRDRRLGQPGMPGFMVWQLPNTSVDPFDTLPIEMPYKSKELFHYFAASPAQKDCTGSSNQLGMPSNIFTPGDPKSDWYVDLSLAAKEPTAFRSTLLLAALHYSWKTGSLQDYENTFLYHKGESIRLVNEWLHNPDAKISAACMKLIATLSVTESCIGNFPAADAHLDGMLTLLDLKEAEKKRNGRLPDDEDPNDEILQRLILVAHNFSRAVKSRLAEGLARQVDLFDIWQKSFSGLAENLTALRLVPFYFATGPDLRVASEVDAEPAIEALKAMTLAVIHRPQQPQAPHYAVYSTLAAGRSVCDSEDPTTCRGCKSLSSLFLAYTEGHVTSLSRHTKGNAGADSCSLHGPAMSRNRKAGLSSSWVGLTTAAGFYLNSVLLLWNGGNPEEPRLFRRLVRMLKQDIALTEDAALRSGKGTRRNAFWFWKVFMGALALQRVAEARGVFETTPPLGATGADMGTADSDWFDSRIRRWSRATKVTTWSEARKALIDIVYPGRAQETPMPSRIWSRAISAGVSANLEIRLLIDPSLEAD